MAKGGRGYSKQAGGGRLSGEVNISFVLDMQRKLYRWSYEDPNKVFVDLFNLVCDRRTLNEAWRRLARNSGSRTPGTDGMTRLTVEQRPGGAAAFLEEIREALRNGTYCPEPVRQRLIPKPGSAACPFCRRRCAGPAAGLKVALSRPRFAASPCSPLAPLRS
jgi:retron-type reverse transcriptase